MPKAKSQKFYAVAKGRETGVFLTWEDCGTQTKGFPGAKFQSFTNAADAEAFVAGTSSATSSHTTQGSIVSSLTLSTAPAAKDTKGKKRVMPSDVADESKYDVVFCDGACKGNGQVGSVAGVGVWWGENDPRNIAERCPGDQTNNRAELIAIARVLETTPKSKKPLLIKTDSQYSIKCFYEWMPKWTQNNFRTANGDPVKNSALIKYISALFKARGLIGQEVRMQYVKGHSGDVGNDGADAQANLGAFLPPIPERDWAKAEKEVLDQAEQDCRTTMQRSTPVPLEVVAGELTTSISGGAQKVRKISHDVPFSRLPSPSLGSPRLRHTRLSSTLAVASSSTTSRSGPTPLHVTSPLRVVDVSSSPPIDPTSKAVPAPFRVVNVSSSPSRDLATQTGPSLGIHKAKGPLAARDASIPESLFASTSTSLSASTSPPKSVAAHAIHKPSLSEETLKLPMSPTSPIRRKHGVGFFTTTPPANALLSTRLSPSPAKKMGLGMGSGARGYGPSSTNNQKAMRVDVADVDFNDYLDCLDDDSYGLDD